MLEAWHLVLTMNPGTQTQWQSLTTHPTGLIPKEVSKSSLQVLGFWHPTRVRIMSTILTTIRWTWTPWTPATTLDLVVTWTSAANTVSSLTASPSRVSSFKMEFSDAFLLLTNLGLFLFRLPWMAILYLIPSSLSIESIQQLRLSLKTTLLLMVSLHSLSSVTTLPCLVHLPFALSSAHVYDEHMKNTFCRSQCKTRHDRINISGALVWYQTKCLWEVYLSKKSFLADVSRDYMELQAWIFLHVHHFTLILLRTWSASLFWCPSLLGCFFPFACKEKHSRIFFLISRKYISLTRQRLQVLSPGETRIDGDSCRVQSSGHAKKWHSRKSGMNNLFFFTNSSRTPAMFYSPLASHLWHLRDSLSWKTSLTLLDDTSLCSCCFLASFFARHFVFSLFCFVFDSSVTLKPLSFSSLLSVSFARIV